MHVILKENLVAISKLCIVECIGILLCSLVRMPNAKLQNYNAIFFRMQ